LFVAFKVNSSGIHLEDRSIAAINDWQVAASKAQLWSFRWLAGYYIKFVLKFAQWTTQLYASTADDSTIWWLQKLQVECDDIQRALASAPVLQLRNPEYDYILCPNVSDTVIGGILTQKQS